MLKCHHSYLSVHIQIGLISKNTDNRLTTDERLILSVYLVSFTFKFTLCASWSQALLPCKFLLYCTECAIRKSSCISGSVRIHTFLLLCSVCVTCRVASQTYVRITISNYCETNASLSLRQLPPLKKFRRTGNAAHSCMPTT